MVTSYYLDTYAMHEIVRGTDNYQDYHDIHAITTRLNLMEFYYTFAKHTNTEFANRFTKYFEQATVQFSMEDVRDAMKFKLHHQETNMSYVDCLGYTIARKRGCLFLTGDEEFERFENVEYVK